MGSEINTSVSMFHKSSLLHSSSTQLSIIDLCLRSWLAERCQSEASRLSYKRDLSQFGAYLKGLGRDPLAFTRDDVVTWLEFLRTQRRSASTRAKKLTVLKGMVRTLMLEGLFPRDRAERILDIKAPKVSRDGRTPGLSRKEARLLLDAPDPGTPRGARDRAILAVLLYTGCRRSALCNIRLGHLLHEQGVHYILLHEKGERLVRAPLHPQASERIHLWIDVAGLRNSDPHGWLFRPFNRRGSQLLDKPLHEFMPWYIVKTHAREAGLQVDRLDERGICAHSTRVTAITASFEGGAKLEEIQQLVGHKDARNTLRYRRSSPRDAQNAVLRINY